MTIREPSTATPRRGLRRGRLDSRAGAWQGRWSWTGTRAPPRARTGTLGRRQLRQATGRQPRRPRAPPRPRRTRRRAPVDEAAGRCPRPRTPRSHRPRPPSRTSRPRRPQPRRRPPRHLRRPQSPTAPGPPPYGASRPAQPRIFDLPDHDTGRRGNGVDRPLVLGGAAAAEGRTSGSHPRIAGPASPPVTARARRARASGRPALLHGRHGDHRSVAPPGRRCSRPGPRPADRRLGDRHRGPVGPGDAQRRGGGPRGRRPRRGVAARGDGRGERGAVLAPGHHHQRRSSVRDDGRRDRR